MMSLNATNVIGFLTLKTLSKRDIVISVQYAPEKIMIVEENGRWTCTECGYEWSAIMGDDEIPELCECEIETCDACGLDYSRNEGHSCLEPRGGLD